MMTFEIEGICVGDKVVSVYYDYSTPTPIDKIVIAAERRGGDTMIVTFADNSWIHVSESTLVDAIRGKASHVDEIE